MIYGYIRVSTDHQTTENQRFEIKQFCEKERIVVERWIEETISGTTVLSKRKLGRLLKSLKKGDMIIASELSRLGRNLLQIMSILHHCMDVGAQVWTIKDNYRLGSDITSKVLAFAFGLSAEIERNLISQRTKEALARRKYEGVKLGRREGFIPGKKMDYYQEYMLKQISKGCSKTDLAKRLHVSVDSLDRYLAFHNMPTKWKHVRGAKISNPRRDPVKQNAEKQEVEKQEVGQQEVDKQNAD